MVASVLLDKHTYSRNGNRAYLYEATRWKQQFEGLACIRNRGISGDSRRFRRARDRFCVLRTRRLSGRAIYAGKWLQSALDPTCETILSFSPLRPRLSNLLSFVSPSSSPLHSGSLACRKVQNTRRKRAIRDRTPLTFHFSWSKIIRSPSYVPCRPVHSSDNIISPVCLRIEIVFRSVKNTVTNRSLINSSRIR